MTRNNPDVNPELLYADICRELAATSTRIYQYLVSTDV
jgi:hypothetical protein